MSFVLEGTVKIDILMEKNAARRAANQLRAQRSGSQLEAKKKPVRRMRKALRLFSSPQSFF